MPPTTLHRDWSVKDRALAMALIAAEADIGPCGHPHSQTTGDLEGWFEVNDEVVCWACYAADEDRKDHAETGTPSGAIARVIDTRTVTDE